MVREHNVIQNTTYQPTSFSSHSDPCPACSSHKCCIAVAVPGDGCEGVNEFANLREEDVAVVEKCLLAKESICKCNLCFGQL